MPDELQELWRRESGAGKEGEEMLSLVIERTRTFDRRIAARNTAEIIAALIVAAIFGWAAAKLAPTLVERLGFAIVAVSGIWIAYYVLRRGAGPRRIDPGLPITAYRERLLDNYDHQIRLLKTVKYWYVLPPYLGLLIVNLGLWLRTANTISLVTNVATLTIVFGGVWLLNEVVGVRRLERLKRELIAAGTA